MRHTRNVARGSVTAIILPILRPYGTKTGAREVPFLPICRRYATKKGAREVPLIPKFVDG